jgi:hypothetical protein
MDGLQATKCCDLLRELSEPASRVLMLFGATVAGSFWQFFVAPTLMPQSV